MSSQNMRRAGAVNKRVKAAALARDRPHPQHDSNGDEDRFLDASGNPTLIASFTKGLPHTRNSGLIFDSASYGLFVREISTGDPEDIRAIPLGPPDSAGPFHSGIARSSPNPGNVRAWESMSAGLEFDLEGPDAHAVTMPPAPTLNSLENSFEMSELYWTALLRDVPFTEFTSTPMISQAVKGLSSHPWIANPTENGAPASDKISKQRKDLDLFSIFRGVLPGDRNWPYISQFLLYGTSGLGGEGGFDSGMVQYGSIRIDQRVCVAQPNLDYMTTFGSWLDVQNAADLGGLEVYKIDGARFRFISTPRYLATYVHYDALYEAYLNACLILLDINAPLDEGIPFTDPDKCDKQSGFATFGGPHILSLVTEVATRALKAVRFQKFNIHRRLRPEASAWLIDSCLRGNNTPAFKDASKLANSIDDDLLVEIFRHNGALNRSVTDGNFPRSRDFDPGAGDSRNGTYLLPMAFPEGSPMHPSYGAGHATVAGACVTVLKAFFNTEYELPMTFVPDASGSKLVKTNHKLTVGGELNKVCSNVSIGRNWAGVHYYTDYIESVKMGEEIAIGILKEQKLTFNENFTMSLTKFDGSPLTI